MSRNLCRTDCAICTGPVRVVSAAPMRVSSGAPPITGKDAQCAACGTKYFAWFGTHHPGASTEGVMTAASDFFDLSYRSTMNDEPGPDDLPAGNVEALLVVEIDGREVYRNAIRR
jgi:hypothetical protein